MPIKLKEPEKKEEEGARKAISILDVKRANLNLVRKKSKLYIMGPKQIAGESYIVFYENIVRFCRQYFDEVICTYPDLWDTKKTDKEHYKSIKELVKSCDAIVAECSTPATGLGVQLEMAVEAQVPVILLEKVGMKASGLALGCPAVRAIVRYSDQNSLHEHLKKEFAAL